MGAYKTDPDHGNFGVKYGQEFSVSNIIVHPSYDKVTDSNDIALLKLDRKATIST